MARIKDETGNRYGKLMVIEYSHTQKEAFWVCKCDCGNEKVIRGTSLRNGATKSCGCIKKGAPVVDETGNRYGKLTVIERVSSTKYRSATWRCLCDCGNEKEIRGSSLRNGGTKSCGCLIKETGNPVVDETGNKYGKLTVIERAGSTEAGRATWRCLCDCGNEKEIEGRFLRNGEAKSCGCIMSKGELAITHILQEFGIEYKKEYTFPDLKSDANYPLRFDFAIFKEGKLSHLVEFDGPQHYNKDDRWYTEKGVYHDNLKNQYCQDNNIRLIRIRNYKNLELKNIL